MNLSTFILKTFSLAVLIGFFCDTAFAIKIIVPPLEPDKLQGVWISPVGEFAQTRLVMTANGYGTLAISPQRDVDQHGVQVYSVSRVNFDDYSVSFVLQPENGSSLISVTGYANQDEIKFSLPAEDDFSDAVSTRLVPEEVARKEIKDIERLQAILTDRSM